MPICIRPSSPKAITRIADRVAHPRGLNAPVTAVTWEIDDQAPILRLLVRQAERVEQPAPEAVLDDPLVDGPGLEVLKSLLWTRHVVHEPRTAS